MDAEEIYQNVEHRDIKNTTGPPTQSNDQDEGNDEKRRGCRCLVLMTLCLWLMCVLLLVFITLQHITITAERDLLKSYKNTVEEFNHTINSLQDNYTDLMTEKDQLKNNLKKKLELETRVNNLTTEKKKLESKVMSLSKELKKKPTKQACFSISNEKKSWSESRTFCRDRGADLIIINTEEKQRFISSFVKERVWIGLTDIENEGNMKWVDNSPLNRG
ncbi:unnamed protein product [Leuciscus chuanchicus]